MSCCFSALGHREDLHGGLSEVGAEFSGSDSAPECVDDLTPEPTARHAVQQKVGGGVEVVQHVGHVADDIDGNGVVVSVEVFVIVYGAQDTVGDEARQAEDHKRHRDEPEQQQRPAGRTSCLKGPDCPAFFFSEETTGAEQLVRDQRVKDNDEQDGNSTGQEGCDPNYYSGVDRISIKTARNRNSLSIQSSVHLEHTALYTQLLSKQPQKALFNKPHSLIKCYSLHFYLFLRK